MIAAVGFPDEEIVRISQAVNGFPAEDAFQHRSNDQFITIKKNSANSAEGYAPKA
jgi:hypothetical protein